METENKKILNASKNTVDGIQFKSRLEAMIYKTLKDKGIDVKYEPKRFVVWEGYRPTVPFYDKDKNTALLKLNNKKIIDITYTPDFIFKYNDIIVVMEAKGIENDVFYIKKKLFRKLLESSKNTVLYFEVYSKKQLMQALEIIEHYEQDNSTPTDACISTRKRHRTRK